METKDELICKIKYLLDNEDISVRYIRMAWKDIEKGCLAAGRAAKKERVVKREIPDEKRCVGLKKNGERCAKQFCKKGAEHTLCSVHFSNIENDKVEDIVSKMDILNLVNDSDE